MGPWDRSLLPFACASPNKVWLELVLSTGASVYIYVGASSRYSDISIINSCQFDAPVDLLQGPTCLTQKHTHTKKHKLENYICQIFLSIIIIYLFIELFLQTPAQPLLVL